MRALEVSRPKNGQQYPIAHLIPQILSGHRLWASAASAKERFISLQRIQFIENRRSQIVWLRMYLFADDIKRLGYTQNDVLVDAQVSTDFRNVRCSEKVDGRRLICIEEIVPNSYGRHGVDLATDLVGIIKKRLWAIVGSTPPYRRYYLYLCPTAECANVVPQLEQSASNQLGTATNREHTHQEELTDLSVMQLHIKPFDVIG
jgi:hypothetical protein